MTPETETLMHGRCHCEDCQRMHGNFNAFLAAPKGDVRMAGQDALIWYQSSNADHCRDVERSIHPETSTHRKIT